MAFLSACSSQRAQTPPPKPAPPPLEFLGEWGTRGSGPGQLSFPGRLARDASGAIYVTDEGTGFIHKLDARGKPLQSFAHELLVQERGQPFDKYIPGPTYSLGGIAVDRGGAIYVTLPSQGRLLVFYPDGTLLRQLKVRRISRLDFPYGVAVDDNGYIYVGQQRSGRIDKFNSRGRFMKSWGKEGTGPGEFISPVELAFGPDGFLYVADARNDRLQKFSRDGEYVAEIRIQEGKQQRDGDVPGICFYKSYLLVAEGRSHSIHVLSLDGRLVLTVDLRPWVCPAHEEGGLLELESPSALALGAPNELLVRDRGPKGARVLRFRINF